MRHWLPAVGLALATQASATPITANTVEHFPYQYLANGELLGPLADTVACINNQQPAPWKIEITPWARALYNFQEGSAQIIFPVYHALPDAVLSPPLTIERWQWFSHKPKPGGRLGAVRGSNEHKWLQSQQLEVAMLVTQPEQLLRLLSQGRIDSFLGDEKSVEALAAQQRINIDSWHRQFIRFTPLFLAIKPTANEPHSKQLQAATLSCAMASMALTDREQRLTQAFARQAREALNTLISATPSGDASSEQEIRSREAAWRTTELWENPHIDQPLSRKLEAWLNGQAAVKEVIVMGTYGETLAAYPKPSDYWQGDEVKWLNTLDLAPDQFLLEPIAYDQSTGQFIAHIGWRLEESGAVSLGIDIEQLLQSDMDTH